MWRARTKRRAMPRKGRKTWFCPLGPSRGARRARPTNIEIREPQTSGSRSETLGRTNAHPTYWKCTKYAFPHHTSHYGVGVES
eukprot:7080661-Prymnesium_polylepis.1